MWYLHGYLVAVALLTFNLYVHEFILHWNHIPFDTTEDYSGTFYTISSGRSRNTHKIWARQEKLREDGYILLIKTQQWANPPVLAVVIATPYVCFLNPLPIACSIVGSLPHSYAAVVQECTMRLNVYACAYTRASLISTPAYYPTGRPLFELFVTLFSCFFFYVTSRCTSYSNSID